MFSQNLQKWLNQVEQTASVCYEKYAQGLGDPSCPIDIAQNYCSLAKNNFDLRDVLLHIKTYDSIYKPEQCSACKYNDSHKQALWQTFKKYENWINKMRTN